MIGQCHETSAANRGSSELRIARNKSDDDNNNTDDHLDEQHERIPITVRQRRRNQRSVCFNLQRNQYYVEISTAGATTGFDDDDEEWLLSMEQIRARCWYNKCEYKEIRNDNYETLKLQKKGHTDPERFGHCFRGLECKLNENRQRRNQHMTNAIEAVLTTQAFDDDICPTLVAKIYREQTEQCQMEAWRRGLWDATNSESYVCAITNCQQASQVVVVVRQGDDVAPKVPKRHGTWARAG
jgi:hypothetical protein